MKRVVMVTLASLVITSATFAVAQQPGEAALETPPTSPSDLPPPVHPDLLRHLEQMRRYESPRQMARMKAAEEAQQRRARLSAQRWYGYSPLRPIVGATPSMGNYYPIWNTDVPRPFRWYGISHPIMVDADELGVH